MAKYNDKKPSFIVPYKGRQLSPRSGYKSLGTSKATGVSKIEEGKREVGKGITPSNAMDAANRLLTAVGTPVEVAAARVAIGVVDSVVHSLANNSAKALPYYYHTSSLDVDSTKTYIVRFNVGKKSTSSVRTAESIHGLINLQMNNSLSECQDLKSRKHLGCSFGFNQKRFDFLGTKFYTSVNDYVEIYKIKNYRDPVYGARVPYGLVKEEFSNVRTRNSNTYHKLKFKIHVVKITDDDVSIFSLYSKVVNKTKDIQNFGSIPKIYQISDANYSNPFLRDVLCHYGVGLKKSSDFLTQSNIVKNFTKILNPGDIFDFRMVHHMGPGIRIDIAQTYLNASAKGEQPSGYGLIVEAEGTLCQGMRLKDKAIFQGNCAGWYNYEFSKGLKLVRQEGANYCVKYYDRQYLSESPITFNADVIGRPDEKDKEFTILSTSKQHVVFGTNISDNIKKKSSLLEEVSEDFDSYNELESEDVLDE